MWKLETVAITMQTKAEHRSECIRNTKGIRVTEETADVIREKLELYILSQHDICTDGNITK